MNTVKLALIGYGNVGKAFAEMLERRREDIEKQYGKRIIISAISTRRRGSLIKPDGIAAAAMKDEDFLEGIDSFSVVNEADYDILVELTPVNIMTGQPATDHIRQALSRGKHVITANKGPVAWFCQELKELAEKNHVCFFHEAAVMDGSPVFNLYRENLKLCKITEVKGILNATTNYILAEMENGVTFEDAVAEGQKRGFVEADPSMDLEGWDAAAKLTALMNILMGVKITPKEIERTGIGHITEADLKAAKEKGNRIKLICRGKIADGKPVGKVGPELVSSENLFAAINGTAAMVTLTTDLMGEVSIIEHVYQPEIDQTAYGVLIDLLNILDSMESAQP